MSRPPRWLLITLYVSVVVSTVATFAMVVAFTLDKM